jgi:hypothetical protein
VKLTCSIASVWPGGRRLIAGSLGLRHGLPGPALSPRAHGLRLRVAGTGIPPSHLEVDGTAVLRAAETAVRLWVDDPFCSAD